jgi:hypothetical protein
MTLFSILRQRFQSILNQFLPANSQLFIRVSELLEISFKCKLLSQKANVYGLLLIHNFYFHASLDSRRLIRSYRTESCQSWIAFLKPLCLCHNPKCRPKTYQILFEGHPYFQAVSSETRPWVFIFPAFNHLILNLNSCLQIALKNLIWSTDCNFIVPY